MGDFQVSLTDEERDYILQLLRNSLQSHRIEEHRTRSPIYRQAVLEEEDILIRVLTKLGSSGD